MRWFDKAGLAMLMACVAVIANAVVASANSFSGAGWIDLLWWLRR